MSLRTSNFGFFLFASVAVFSATSAYGLNCPAEPITVTVRLTQPIVVRTAKKGGQVIVQVVHDVHDSHGRLLAREGASGVGVIADVQCCRLFKHRWIDLLIEAIKATNGQWIILRPHRVRITRGDVQKSSTLRSQSALTWVRSTSPDGFLVAAGFMISVELADVSIDDPRSAINVPEQGPIAH